FGRGEPLALRGRYSISLFQVNCPLPLGEVGEGVAERPEREKLSSFGSAIRSDKKRRSGLDVPSPGPHPGPRPKGAEGSISVKYKFLAHSFNRAAREYILRPGEYG